MGKGRVAWKLLARSTWGRPWSGSGRRMSCAACRGLGARGLLLGGLAALRGDREVRESEGGHSAAGTARRRRGHSADHGDVRAVVAVASASSTTPVTKWCDLGRSVIVEKR